MSDLEDKIIQIEAQMESKVQSLTTETVWTTHYGAFEIDPKHLVYKICVQSEAERIRLVNHKDLKQQLRDLLTEYKYPAQARSKVIISFDSDESIDRDSGGNAWRHWR